MKADGTTDLRVFWASSYNFGGCNNCSRHMGSDGQRTHQILNVQMERGMSVRFCEPCLKELQAAIRNAPSASEVKNG